MKWFIATLTLGFVFDLCFGDPHWLPHPVRWIGSLISWGEKKLRRYYVGDAQGKDRQKRELRAGRALVILVLMVSTSVPFLLLLAARNISSYLELLLGSIMCYQMLATKSLKDESMKVYNELKKSNIPAARTAVSMIVGRDTANLTKEGIAKAAVETIAENTSDGILAPLIYMAMGGPVLGIFYKAVNTMDSMVGYKNDKYLYFGRAAAKLDDICNFVPARVSAILMIIAAYVIGLDGKKAYQIFRRDRFCHASPNSAQTEAVCAGALGVQLAGDAYYFGKLVPKKSIGDPDRAVTYQDIKRANQLLYATALLGMLGVCCLYAVW